MRKIMEIFDVFEVERGIIVAGVDPALDTLAPDQLREVIGTEIEILNTDGAKAKYSVLGVETTNSIVDKKNVFILLPPGTKTEDIRAGAVVYSFAEHGSLNFEPPH